MFMVRVEARGFMDFMLTHFHKYFPFFSRPNFLSYQCVNNDKTGRISFTVFLLTNHRWTIWILNDNYEVAAMAPFRGAM